MHLGAEGQDPFELLHSQHQEVDSLFSEFEHTGKGAARGRKQILEEIFMKLTCHAKMEEILFYPRAMKADEDLTLEATEEHGVVKFLLAQIRKMPVTDKTLLAKVKVLKEIVQHHVKEEEHEMFEKMRAKYNSTQLRTLGLQMKEEFDRLMQRLQSKGAVKSAASGARAKKGSAATTRTASKRGNTAKGAKAKASKSGTAKAGASKAGRSAKALGKKSHLPTGRRWCAIACWVHTLAPGRLLLRAGLFSRRAKRPTVWRSGAIRRQNAPPPRGQQSAIS